MRHGRRLIHVVPQIQETWMEVKLQLSFIGRRGLAERRRHQVQAAPEETREMR